MVPGVVGGRLVNQSGTITYAANHVLIGTGCRTPPRCGGARGLGRAPRVHTQTWRGQKNLKVLRVVVPVRLKGRTQGDRRGRARPGLPRGRGQHRRRTRTAGADPDAGPAGSLHLALPDPAPGHPAARGAQPPPARGRGRARAPARSRAGRARRGRVRPAAARGPERPAARARQAEGRVHLARLARAAHAADLDPRLPRGAARRRPARREQLRYIGVVDRNSERLLDLVSDLLFLAQVDAGKLDLELRPVDLEALVAELRRGRRCRRPRRRAIELTASTQHLPVEFRGDPARLAQVLDNLVSNALKFTPAGGRVEVALKAADGVARDRGERHRASGWPRRSRSTSSNASSAARAPPRTRSPAPASAWRSRRRSSSATAAESGSRAPSTSARPFGSSCRFRSRSSGARRRTRRLTRVPSLDAVTLRALIPLSHRTLPVPTRPAPMQGSWRASATPCAAYCPFAFCGGWRACPRWRWSRSLLVLAVGALFFRSEVAPERARARQQAPARRSRLSCSSSTGRAAAAPAPVHNGHSSGSTTAASGSGSSSGSTQSSRATGTDCGHDDRPAPSAARSARHGFSAAGRGATGPQGKRGEAGPPGPERPRRRCRAFPARPAGATARPGPRARPARRVATGGHSAAPPAAIGRHRA